MDQILNIFIKWVEYTLLTNVLTLTIKYENECHVLLECAKLIYIYILEFKIMKQMPRGRPPCEGITLSLYNKKSGKYSMFKLI